MEKKLILLLGTVAAFSPRVTSQDFGFCQGTTENFFGFAQGSLTEAQNSCGGLGGQLKTFDGQEDFFEISQNVQPGSTFLVGIVSNGAPEISTTKFTSIDGNDFGIDFVIQAGVGNFPWETNQPDTVFENCVVISGDSGLLADVECEQPHGFICEIPDSPACGDITQDFGFCEGVNEQFYSSSLGVFADGLNFCGSLGGQIKTFDDENDFFQISGNLPPNSNNRFYVGIISGLPDEISTSKFISFDENNVGIDFVTQAGIGNFPWDFGQPDSASDGCVVLSGDSRLLSDVNCNELHGVVCEIPNSPKCAQTGPSALCFNDEVVVLDPNGGTFGEAIENCVLNFGANLYSVGSNVERQAILELEQQLGNLDVWIGVRFNGLSEDFLNPVNFEFVDGTDNDTGFFQVLNGEFPWSSGEPSGFECVKMDGSTGLFVTADCSEVHPFVCSFASDCGEDRVIPNDWSCFPSFFNRTDGCHCSCGVQDPDCDSDFFQQLLNCGGESNKCIDAECVNTVPPEWTCDFNSFDSGDGCDCNCGAPDPDCDSPNQEVRNCGPGAECIEGDCVGGLQLEFPSEITCFEQNLFIYFSNPKDIDTASQLCQFVIGGQLASPRNEELMSLFATLSSDSILNEMTMGMILDNSTLLSFPADFLPLDTEFFEDNGTEFFQGVGIGEFPWASSEPNGNPEDIQQCVSYNRDTNTISDESCLDERPFVCVGPQSCSDFVIAATCIGNETWVVLGQSGSFLEFEAACASEKGGTGGRVAPITNANELEQIKLMTGFANLEGPFWVGVNAPDGGFGNPLDFSFTDGSTEGLDFIHTEVGEFPWDLNQPDGDGEIKIEDCVVIDVSTGLLSDIDCNEIHFGVCILSDDQGICQPINETLTVAEVPTDAPTTSPLSTAEQTSTHFFCHGPNYHSYFSQPQTFATANQICQNFNGGFLNSPRSIRDLEVFSSLSEISLLADMWVGVSLSPNTLVSNPAEFLSLDEQGLGIDGIEFFQNASVGEFPWAAGEPNGTPETPQQCVSYDRQTNTLSDESCEELKPFLCVIPNFCGTVAATCVGPDLYIIIPNSNINFDSYLANCPSGDAVADISNAEELQIVNNALKFSGVDFGDGVWVGINAPNGSFGDPADFVFVDGTTDGLDFIQTEQGVFPWAPNEPDGGQVNATEDCAAIDPVSGLLRDVSCLEIRSGLCKQINREDLCQEIDVSLQGTAAPTTPNPTLSPAPPTTEPTIAPSVSPTSAPSPAPSTSPTSSPTVTDPAPECRARLLGIRRPFPQNPENLDEPSKGG